MKKFLIIGLIVIVAAVGFVYYRLKNSPVSEPRQGVSVEESSGVLSVKDFSYGYSFSIKGHGFTKADVNLKYHDSWSNLVPPSSEVRLDNIASSSGVSASIVIIVDKEDSWPCVSSIPPSQKKTIIKDGITFTKYSNDDFHDTFYVSTDNYAAYHGGACYYISLAKAYNAILDPITGNPVNDSLYRAVTKGTPEMNDIFDQVISSFVFLK